MNKTDNFISFARNQQFDSDSEMYIPDESECHNEAKQEFIYDGQKNDQKQQYLKQRDPNKKVQHLTHEERELLKCTFKPKLINKNSKSRTFDQFLEDQNQFLEIQRQKQETLKDFQMMKEDSPITLRQIVDQKKMVENFEYYQYNVHDRLYYSQNQDQEQDENSNLEESYERTPSISEKSRQLVGSRSNKVETLLYQDALRRNAKQQISQKQLEKKSSISNFQTSQKNQQILIKKFVKTYCEICPDLNIELNKEEFCKLLQILGYVNYDVQNQTEAEKVYQIWDILSKNDQVLSKNLMIFLIAINGLHMNDQVKFQDIINQSQQEISQDFIILSKKEQTAITKEFELLNRNRIQSQETKVQRNYDDESYNFSPKIDLNSKNLANKYREKVLQNTAYMLENQLINANIPEDGKISHADMLILQKQAKEQQLQQIKEEIENRELQQCSFQPKTNSKFKSNKQDAVLRNILLHEQSKLKNKIDIDPNYLEFQRNQENCTFRPNLNKKHLNSKKDPMNKEKIDQEIKKQAKRISQGHQQQQIVKYQTERGLYENKKKNFENKNLFQNLENQREPLLFVDVNMGANGVKRIEIFDGDNSQSLAKQFALVHGLDQEKEQRLKTLLDQQISSYMNNQDAQNDSLN